MLEITGKFGVEIRDKETDELVQEVWTPNTVVDGGILQVARWLSRQQFPDSTVKTFGSVDRSWDEFSRIRIDDGSVTRVIGYDAGNYDGNRKAIDGYTATYDSDYVYRGTYESSYVIDLPEVVDLKAVGIIGHRSSYPGEVGRDNGIQIRYQGYNTASAGDANYNGDFQTRWTEYNGHPSYKHVSNEAYLFANPSGYWILSGTMGGAAAYETSDIVEKPSDGTWTIGTSAGPVPTFSDRQSDSRWLMPRLRYEDVSTEHTSPRAFVWYNKDWDVNSLVDTGDGYSWIDDNQMGIISFEGNEEQFTDDHRWHGCLREVDGVKLYHYHVDGDSHFDTTWYVRRVELFVENHHPHNPSVLKLGTDNGTILPLASGNAALGAEIDGWEWKCENVVQPSGTYKIRFLKSLGAADANDIQVSEIGLFMSASGHYTNTLPDIEYCNDLFARSIFDTPWTKDDSQYATLYYEIEVS